MNDLQIGFALSLSKYKSFDLTEQNIYVSQPVIRNQITALEKELGVQLFVRSKQSVTLTEEGKIIIEAFKAMKNIHNQALDRAKQLTLNKDSRFVVNIGYLQFMYDFEALNPSLQKIKAKYPAASFQFTCDNPAQLNASLYDGSMEIINTTASEIDRQEDIEHILLGEYRRAVILSSRHPLARKEKIDLSMLRNEQIFIFSPEGYRGLPDYMKIVLETFDASHSAIKPLPNVGSMFASIEACLGIGVFAATPAILESPAVRCFPINGPPLKTVLAWKSNNKKKLLHELIRMIRADITVNEKL